MDVINRGLGGYNTHWGLAVLPLILEELLGPSISAQQVDNHTISNNNDDVGGQCQQQEEEVQQQQQQQQQQEIPQYTFVIAYGANDSCLLNGPHSRHHVTINNYSNNLQRMIQMIRTWKSNKMIVSTTTKVVLMTPPPCDTNIQYPSRDNENSTRLYAETCVLVGKNLGVPVVDLWNGMQQQQQRQQQQQQQLPSQPTLSSFWQEEYLSDGLHLTPMGNYRVYELLLNVLEAGEESGVFLGLTIPNLPRSYPDHTMVNATHPQQTFGVVNNTCGAI